MGAMMVAPRPDLFAVPAATHGGPDGVVGRVIRADFSTSVNAFGPAPSLLAAMRDSVTPRSTAAYPDPTNGAARRAIAAHACLAVDDVCVGAGATELILSVLHAFTRPGDSVLVPAHGFGEYARAAAIVGAHVVTPSSTSSGTSLESAVGAYVRCVVDHTPRVAFLCTPESPSGRAWPMDAVADVATMCARAGTLLVIDQSFDAFAAAPLGTPALRGHPTTLHLRSLTKDHALAGVRLGFLAGPGGMVAAVERVRMPWSVSALAQVAAVALHTPESLAHVRHTTAILRAEAARVGAAFRTHGINTRPTDVHYMLADVGSATAVSRDLEERYGLRVRDCTSFGLPRHIRVAARMPGENDILLAALGDLCGRRTGGAAHDRTLTRTDR